MEEEEELVERQQLQKKRRTEQLLTSGEVMSILRSQGIMLIFLFFLNFLHPNFR